MKKIIIAGLCLFACAVFMLYTLSKDEKKASPKEKVVIESLEAELMTLVCGARDRTTPESFSEEVERTKSLLTAIRSRYPQMRNVTFGIAVSGEKGLIFQVTTDKFRQQDARRSIYDFFQKFPNMKAMFEDYVFDDEITLSILVKI